MCAYLYINMLSTTIDMRRQIIDMQHPMYDIMVSASASVDYNKNVCIHYATISNICLPVLVHV